MSLDFDDSGEKIQQVKPLLANLIEAGPWEHHYDDYQAWTMCHWCESDYPAHTPNCLWLQIESIEKGL